MAANTQIPLLPNLRFPEHLLLMCPSVIRAFRLSMVTRKFGDVSNDYDLELKFANLLNGWFPTRYVSMATIQLFFS